MRSLLLVLCLMLAACSGGAPEDAAATAATAAPASATDPGAEPAAAPPAAAPVESPAVDAAPDAVAPVAPVPADGATAPAEAPKDTVAAPAPSPEAARRPADDGLTQDGVHYGCQTDADCQVKDVGNCCGYYPACVNKDSPTFPDQVKAKCAAEGMSSICGFPEISGCQCVEGRCAALSGPGGAVQ